MCHITSGHLSADIVKLWQVESNGEDRKVEYLATLSKHTQAVNVVRWSPKSKMASALSSQHNVVDPTDLLDLQVKPSLRPATTAT